MSPDTTYQLTYLIQKFMSLRVKGTVRNIIENEPYKDKQGREVKSFDYDVLDEGDRKITAVTSDTKLDCEVGDEVEIPVRMYTGKTKNGEPFSKLLAV